ncbi:MAG: lytic murein transglycosylase [Micavibrio sp.]|nr:MAG: lytic murein transglycosylase [Micavibrio sp.]
MAAFRYFAICTAFVIFAAVWSLPVLAAGDRQDFGAWLEELRQEARQKGISERILREALHDGIRPLPRVLELDRRQPEGTLSFEQYKNNMLGVRRVQTGRLMMRRHEEALQEAGRQYGVPPAVIAALWGMETNYGGYTGGFNVIEALATLAYDGRRGPFFRGELLAALQILEEGHIKPSEMKGSWAGAMGQSQFMPTSFLNYAVDADGDGRRDIWGTHRDVFASAANYLAQHGWRSGERWGRRVQLPQNFPETLTGLDTEKTLAEWQALGVRREDGANLPQVEGMTGSVIKFTDNEAYLVYNNFRVIMRWNRSTYFATAVGLLSDQLSY